MTVLAGRDEFKVEQGAWNVLGADALLLEVMHIAFILHTVHRLTICSQEGKYVPDFSAFVSSDTFRCLSLPKALWSPRLLARQPSFSPGTYPRALVTSSPLPPQLALDIDQPASNPMPEDEPPVPVVTRAAEREEV